VTLRKHVVLDASAVLAVFQKEPGWQQVASHLGGSKISAVNWSEVVQKNAARDVSLIDTQAWALATGLQVVDFDREAGEDAAMLYESCSSAGLSLGDRACLALARREGLQALTANRAWSSVDAGVQVVLFK
jgi:PIN domain nuclease of toxin-antitoxin system